MDKKQRISWGVSFGSLALVAGMTAFFDLGTGNNTQSTINQYQNSQSGYFSNQDPNSGHSFDRGFGRHRFDENNGFGGNSSDGNSEQSFDDNSSNFDQNSGDDSSNFNQDFGSSNGQDQFSNGGFGGGHQGGFDTTTGGT